MSTTEYQATLDWLYAQVPAFHRTGAGAYKPGLATALALGRAFGNPHDRFRSIHVAGTNGKGSTAHTLAAILQKSGYKTGLYTSPHLVDFRERIRIGGKMIPESAVVDFIRRYRAHGFDCEPSFFELTMTMAFDFFARECVDVAVIEVGLGGRLDSTNIITPDLSVITNISLDHTALLGNTPAEIAAEKAGIIKPGVPVVIGEASDAAVRRVFVDTAVRRGAPLRFAAEVDAVPDRGGWLYCGGKLFGELGGECQPRNAATILAAVDALRGECRYRIPDEAVRSGFAGVTRLTGLMGRWMKVADAPLTVCDTGHNPGGWRYIADNLSRMPGRLHVVVGFAADKDVDAILEMMPREARFFFTCPATPRGLPADVLAAKAAAHGLAGCVCPEVADAVAEARKSAGAADSIFVGGSNFVVADFLAGCR